MHLSQHHKLVHFAALMHPTFGLQDNIMQAIGLIETKGLVGLVEATDAMAKAANVQIVKRIGIGGALVSPRTASLVRLDHE